MPLSLPPLALISAWLTSLGFIGLTSLAAWLIIVELKIRLSRLEQISLGIIGGILGSSWLTLISWRIVGQNFGTGLVVAICLVVLGWRRHHLKTAFATLVGEIGSRKIKLPPMVWILFGSLLTTLITWLCYTHFLPSRPTGWGSAGNTWADLALHMTLASWFIVHGTSQLVLPVFTSSNLTYPFLVDLHSAQLYWLSGSWAIAFGLPSFLLICNAGYLIYRLGQRLGGSRRVGAIWLWLVYFSGSAGSIIALIQDVFGGTYSNSFDYSNLASHKPETLYFFANYITSHLLPQRSYLLGLSVVLSCLTLLASLLEHHKPTQRQWLGLGLMAGLLPFGHVHSYFVIMAVIGLQAIWLSATSSQKSNGMWLTLLIALLIGSPQVIWQFASSYHAGFSQFATGWLTPKGDNPLNFWLLNLGLFGLMAPLAVWHWLKSKSSQNDQKSSLFKVIIVSGTLIFIVCNLVIFQPSGWDNMKFLTYAYLFISLPVAWWLARLSRGRIMQLIGVGLLILIMTATGLQSVYLESTNSYELFSESDQSLAEYVVKNISPQATILTDTNHNNPIPTLTGRKIIMGYPGWLGSYGINYLPVEQDMQRMWQLGPDSQALLNQYRVDYIAVNNTSTQYLETDIGKLQASYPEIYTNSQWQIFKIR